MSPDTQCAVPPCRVAIVISSLSTGGAERGAVNLANVLVGEGFDVSIDTLEPGDAVTMLELDSRVALRRHGLAGSSRSVVAGAFANWRRIRALRLILRTSVPDIVVSFVHQTNIMTILASIGLRVPVIACEESEPSRAPGGRIWRALRWSVYPLAAAVVVHTRGAREWFARLPFTHVQIIPNAVGLPGDLCAPPASAREPLVLSVGRLGAEKGYDVLLPAFAAATAESPQWRLVILGEGAERPGLESLARQLGVMQRVSLPGITDDPWSYYRRAAIFVSSSRHEGFGIALCEAMAAGCAAVATDCPSGPREIVEHEHNGLLVGTGDARQLAEAIRRLIDAPDLRDRLARHGREVAVRFHPDVIRREWIALIQARLPGESPT